MAQDALKLHQYLHLTVIISHIRLNDSFESVLF